MFKIYFKEMKDSFRDRRTLLLTVMLPVIMMTGLTLFYEAMMSDDGEDTYTLAVEESISPEEESILAAFENIELVKTDDVKQVVLDGEAQAALKFSPNFVESIATGEEASVQLLGDSFSQNSSTLMSLVSNALSAFEKTVISERLQQEGVEQSVIQPFVIEQQELSDEDGGVSLLAMLIPLILVVAIGVGSGPSASDLFAGEKERKTMEALLMTPIKRSTLVFAKWMAIATIGAITGIITIIVVALEISFLTENLKNSISFGNDALNIVLIGVVVIIVYAMFIASLQMLTSMFAKTVKEAQSYSTPVMMLPMFPIMFITSAGVTELGFHHFVIPFMNLFALMKELIYGIIELDHILLTIGSNIVYMFVFYIIGRILFMKDKWVMN